MSRQTWASRLSVSVLAVTLSFFLAVGLFLLQFQNENTMLTSISSQSKFYFGTFQIMHWTFSNVALVASAVLAIDAEVPSNNCINLVWNTILIARQTTLDFPSPRSRYRLWMVMILLKGVIFSCQTIWIEAKSCSYEVEPFMSVSCRFDKRWGATCHPRAIWRHSDFGRVGKKMLSWRAKDLPWSAAEQGCTESAAARTSYIYGGQAH